MSLSTSDRQQVINHQNIKYQAVFVQWLHFHQPPIWVGDGEQASSMGNLEKMLHGEPNSEEHWNAQWYALAYKNPARYVKILRQQGLHPRIMVDYSGILLEELAKLSQDGTFDHLLVDGEPIGHVIDLWREVLTNYPECVEFAGTAYSHCYFPATPERDHEAQIMTWRQVFADLFGQEALARVRGFWLPEMGMMGNSIEAVRLIRLIKKCGYEWLILPNSALQHPTGWQTPELENLVHWLTVEAEGERERIPCVVRDTDMGIRQQSGQNTDGCINDIKYRGGVIAQSALLKDKLSEQASIPPLIVPTSDGENGNVMMFEFFRNSFVPLFSQHQNWSDIGFMTVSEYIDRYLPNGPVTEVQLKADGGSWIGGHQSWQEGDLRQRVLVQVEKLSEEYAEALQAGKIQPAQIKPLLLAETSCFVYWGSEFWAQQGERFINWAKIRE